MLECCEKNLVDHGCQNVTILFTKKNTIDFRERTRVESFEYGHDRRRNRFGSRLYNISILRVYIFHTIFRNASHI